jgi:F-box/leucine-rich repeat protein 7
MPESYMHRRNSAFELPSSQPHPARITHDSATANSNSSSSSSTAAPREIIDRLRGFLLFSTAPEPFLEAIASRLVPQVYPARTFIITEGEEARAMYWIIKGTVAIVSRDGEAIHAELGPGAFFGEIGILFDCPRTASVQARERCVIAVLTAGAVNEVLPEFPQVETIIRNEAQERLAVLAKNRQQQQKVRRNSAINSNKSNTATDGTKIESSATNSKFDAAGTTTSADESSKELLPTPPQQRRDLGKYLEHTGIREVLAEMPLFQQLPDSMIHRLALSVEPVSYCPFQMVIEHDTIGKDIYFIIDGQVEVLDDASGTVMARLTRGSYFGEMAFLRLAERRTASVRTITECDCLVVTEATLDSLCEDFPEVHSHIEETAKARLDTNQQLSAGIISNGASSIYLNKRHNSVSSASDHSSSSSTRDDDAAAAAPQQGKPLDHDPFRVRSKSSQISGDSTDSHRLMMRTEKDDNGVELFSKSWNTTGSFDGSLTVLRPPPPDIEPHEPATAAAASSEGAAGMSPVDPAVDMSSFQFDPMGPAQVDTSLPASPHTLPDFTAGSTLTGLTTTNNNNHNNTNSHNNYNHNNNSNNSFNPSGGQRNDFRKQPSPGVSTSSPNSSRHSSRSSFGGFDSIPEEDESGVPNGANGNGGVALAQSQYHQQQQQQTTYKRPLPGILLHPRAKRVRQTSRRRSSLFNVGPFPDFIQIKIFQHLDLRTLMAMQRVCQHWQQILQTSQQLLRELDLRPYNTTINDTTIVPITNFAGLRPKVVDISHCFHLTDEGFSYLVNGIGLAKIHVFRMKSVWEVSSMAIMDLTVPSIGAELEEIDLSNCRKVSDSTLTRLIGWVVPPDSYGGFPGGDPTGAPVVVGCAKLRKISLSYCKHITDRSLYHMAMFAADRIESLDLTRCTTITDHGFSFWNFRPFTALRHLCLADCTFLTDKAIMTIASAAKGLESLVLSFCCALTDLAVEVLALGCPRLRVLEMQYCGSAVSDMSLAAVAHHLHALERLSVRGCVRVTAPGVCALVAVSQSLLYLDITQCRNVTERIVAPRAGLSIKQ